jgi:UDP-N-acetyl-D-glucosamine/UDP-N-acetyl-D-galactosamine dehydrogenase
VDKIKIGVIGLGYVGLPLAAEFGRKYRTVGFDINKGRIKELVGGYDRTLEMSSDELSASKLLTYHCDEQCLPDCNYYVITVPTPIDANNSPDLRPLVEASKLVGRHISEGDTVIYESTVYPGATEEVCVPILEQESGLAFNKDFYCGYSPERINPGDKQHRLTGIIKVTSGSTKEAAQRIDKLYRSIIGAGTYMASSIKVAEAAKVIENTQRDVNIALINELSLIFSKLGIDTTDVLAAAGTKWNFLPFSPGLVGGHCIGVDPFYLTHKAIEVGYHPEIILAGRRINDSMGEYVADRVHSLMVNKSISADGAKVLILGLSFKENCPDIRNTKIIDTIEKLQGYGCIVDVSDPWVDHRDAKSIYGISLVSDIPHNNYDAIIVAVTHRQFVDDISNIIDGYGKEQCIIYDIKGMLEQHQSDERL